MSRKAGTPNRNFPPRTLAEARRVPEVIQNEAGGMEVTRLTLADLLGTTPQSSRFRDLVASSRFYGLTTGGINSEEFALDDLGERATSDDDETRVAAYKAGVMRVAPFRAFFEAFASKKIPGAVAAKEFLTRNAGVPEAHAQDCINHILADAETAGFVREIGSARYVDLAGTPIVRDPTTDGHADEEPDDVADVAEGQVDPAYARGGNGNVPDPHPEPERPSAIFVGGKKGKSLTQLIAILDEYKIPHKEAEQEPNAGRPISQKVADTMKQCGAAIIVFTPDEELRDLDGNPVRRPSQNVVHELGAAGMQYGKRIVIFREETMTLASNYSGVGHITFKDGELSAKGIELFRELIEFGLVKVTVGSEWQTEPASGHGTTVPYRCGPGKHRRPPRFRRALPWPRRTKRGAGRRLAPASDRRPRPAACRQVNTAPSLSSTTSSWRGCARSCAARTGRATHGSRARPLRNCETLT